LIALAKLDKTQLRMARLNANTKAFAFYQKMRILKTLRQQAV
jgi:hypothetical protein